MPTPTTPDNTNVEVVDVPEASRFEIRVDGKTVGLADYLRTDQLVVYPHTEVDEAYNGLGLGSTLARAVLDDARRRNLPVLATCPFISGWMMRHPEYRDLAYQNRSKVAD
ncbi:GNAT family N-acetyltransferase [Streptomyces sp. NPDC052309]|uniref:GNAT family N-acetyltransferase n=1 Tax=Streptomyces sp. NPDC052309 TaxID=3155421 RepID=UPI0034236081